VNYLDILSLFPFVHAGVGDAGIPSYDDVFDVNPSQVGFGLLLWALEFWVESSLYGLKLAGFSKNPWAYNRNNVLII
jgi:hypothetical protein